MAFLGVLLGLALSTVAPQTGGQLRELRGQLPGVIARAEQWVQRRQSGLTELLGQARPSANGDAADRPTGGSAAASAPIRQGIAEQLSGVGRHFFAVFSSTLAVVGGALLIIGEVLAQVAAMLRRWLVTQLALMLVIGAVTTGVLLLLGVKAALALGVIAGLLEFIPYVGPILSAVPAIGMALADSPEKALTVVVAYTAIQQTEAHLLVPMFMKGGLDLPPLVTLLGQAVLGLVFGCLGLLVAVPLLSAAMVAIKMLYVQDVVGDEVSLPKDEGDGGG